MNALLTAIVLWLSVNYALPESFDHPRVEFVSPAEIAAKRPTNVASGAQMHSGEGIDATSVVAIYDAAQRVIYLPRSWTGQSPAESSVLVHEMVHHLQNIARTGFNCPEEREEMAYAAQEKWLALLGRSLESEFQLDGFTLLVRTRCLG